MTIPSTPSEERQPRDAASASSRDKRGKRPPHHHTLSLLGSAREIQRDPLGFLIRTQQLGEVVRLRFLFSPAYLISHPESIKYVLQEHARNYNLTIADSSAFLPSSMIFSSSPESIPGQCLEVEGSSVLISVLFWGDILFRRKGTKIRTLLP